MPIYAVKKLLALHNCGQNTLKPFIRQRKVNPTICT